MSDDLDAVVRALTDPQTGGRSSFSVPCGERRASLEIATDSDWDPIDLVLGCRYDVVARAEPPGYRNAGELVATRPLGIVLTREGRGDRLAKAEGVVIEWQAGDPAFDDATYVKADVTDPDVLAAVLNPTVRAATIELLSQGCEEVRVDVDGNISVLVGARGFKGEKANVVRARLESVIGAFSQLLSDVPTVRHSGLAHPKPPFSRLTWVLGALGAIGWATNVGWAGMVVVGSASLLGKTNHELSVAIFIACVVSGLVGGFVGGTLYGRLVQAKARGRSDAHSLTWRAQLAGFGGFSILVFTAALVLAVAFAT